MTQHASECYCLLCRVTFSHVDLLACFCPFHQLVGIGNVIHLGAVCVCVHSFTCTCDPILLDTYLGVEQWHHTITPGSTFLRNDQIIFFSVAHHFAFKMDISSLLFNSSN